MIALKITALVVFALVAFVALLLAILWLHHLWAHRERRPATVLTLEQNIAQLFRLTDLLQIILCCLLGLMAGAAFYAGWCADAPVWLQP